MAALSNHIAENLANTKPQVCVLDHNGLIIAVSQSWKDKAQSWGLNLSRYGVGEDYLSHCKSNEACEFRAQLSNLLSGETDAIMTHYDCGRPGKPEPFVVIAKREAVGDHHLFSMVHMSFKEHLANATQGKLQDEINSLVSGTKPAHAPKQVSDALSTEFVPVVRPLLAALDALLDAHRMSTSVGDFAAADKDLKMILQIAKQIDEITR